MTRIFVAPLQIFILILVTTGFCCAQQNPECDFSKYKPSFTIVNSHSTTAIKKVQPEYLRVARSIGARGLVVVVILVDKKGNVKKACSKVGHPLLRKSVIKAALKWKFKPNFGFTSKISRRYLQTYLSFNFH